MGTPLKEVLLLGGSQVPKRACWSVLSAWDAGKLRPREEPVGNPSPVSVGRSAPASDGGQGRGRGRGQWDQLANHGSRRRERSRCPARSHHSHTNPGQKSSSLSQVPPPLLDPGGHRGPLPLTFLMWSRNSGEERQSSGLENWRPLYWKRGSSSGSSANSLGGWGRGVRRRVCQPAPGTWLSFSCSHQPQHTLPPGTASLANALLTSPQALKGIPERTVCPPPDIQWPLHKY